MIPGLGLHRFENGKVGDMTLLNMYIRRPIWLVHSYGPESADGGVHLDFTISTFATPAALQFEHSGEPPVKHSPVVCHIPGLLVYSRC